MKFQEYGTENKITLMLLPGTCCDYETNFAAVLEDLAAKYHLICVNYDGFDGSGLIFSDMLTITGKIEDYICRNFDGKIDGALGSSLGGSFVAQLILRENIHMNHGIFGSSDLDQSKAFSAKLQTKIMYPLLASASKKSGKQSTMKKLMVKGFGMSEEVADGFMACFAKFDPKSILNEYYSDLVTCLPDDINVAGTTPHFIYANKMGKKYKKRYEKYFHAPDICEFDMQHEQWLFGDNGFKRPVLEAIDRFMEYETDGK